jgi:hypothetical protein
LPVAEKKKTSLLILAGLRATPFAARGVVAIAAPTIRVPMHFRASLLFMFLLISISFILFYRVQRYDKIRFLRLSESTEYLPNLSFFAFGATVWVKSSNFAA